MDAWAQEAMHPKPTTTTTAFKIPTMNYSYRAILVHLFQQNTTSLAAFGDCLLDIFGYKDINGLVAIKQDIENDALLIRKAHSDAGIELKKDGWTASILQHNTCCPVLYMTPRVRSSLPPDVAGRGVNVGICVIVESADQAVLLSCRAAHMRTFAGAWVPPGGHIEAGETITAAGLRELFEETGLDLRNSHLVVDTLGFWESVYPHLLSAGDPRRHHLVVYLHVVVPQPAAQILTRLKLDSEEVQAAMFLTKEFVSNVVSSDSTLQQGPPESYEVLVVDEEQESGQSLMTIDATSVYQRATVCRRDVAFKSERVTFGTHFALERWLDKARRRAGLSQL
ncbi:nucleoside diphosphate-linked moiety X motif 17-like isoform X3 [Pollicipes pollicipes]|uniref:nucleoside diphosphate-linked moiety X motif 17-like isoform X3 n=1 Tax=Pollicipes pollicipes TaxID=41117 RepID=UPI001884A042|nr:nucleoside diphosphate-linked moiety X motif 17-like isoform X3 [Pollicipes pollicipes]